LERDVPQYPKEPQDHAGDQWAETGLQSGQRKTCPTGLLIQPTGKDKRVEERRSYQSDQTGNARNQVGFIDRIPTQIIRDWDADQLDG
jgi:hypothetical protein